METLTLKNHQLLALLITTLHYYQVLKNVIVFHLDLKLMCIPLTICLVNMEKALIVNRYQSQLSII
jgi:hypothetical protein